MLILLNSLQMKGICAKISQEKMFFKKITKFFENEFNTLETVLLQIMLHKVSREDKDLNTPLHPG